MKKAKTSVERDLYSLHSLEGWRTMTSEKEKNSDAFNESHFLDQGLNFIEPWPVNNSDTDLASDM